MGCFVHIFNVQNRLPAIVHSSQVREEATEDITKIVKEGLFVWVKVLEIMPDRIRLTMKQVNQYNGRQFNKKDTSVPLPLPLHGGEHHADIGALTGIKIEIEEEPDDEGQYAYTDPWEASRMGYMGKVNRKGRGALEEIEETNI